MKLQYLNKDEFTQRAPRLFTILADNMNKIAPTGNAREEDYIQWRSAVAEGLKREERQIVLMYLGKNEIVGYFQYYTNADTFAMEEIQIVPKCQGANGLFRQLYGLVLPHLHKEILYVTAYANKKNEKSMGILRRLGLSIVGENQSGSSFRFQGIYKDLLKWYYKE